MGLHWGYEFSKEKGRAIQSHTMIRFCKRGYQEGTLFRKEDQVKDLHLGKLIK